MEFSTSLPQPVANSVALGQMNCPLSLCRDLDFTVLDPPDSSDSVGVAPLCSNALQCCLLVLPWPLPLRSHPDAPGLLCTPIAQTAEEYLDYLWQQHEQGEQLPPAVVQVWQHWRAGDDRLKFDPDLIEDWWYLLLDAIVSEGYGGLCWLEEEEGGNPERMFENSFGCSRQCP